jgi:hypothetical protein
MDNTALLVSSCDKYEACWEPFAHGLQKYWPEHFRPLYFITNDKDAPYGESIKSGPDRGWAANLHLALESIPEDYVLYAQDDYWIDRPVNGTAIREYLAILQSGKADYIRLYPAPPPGKAFLDDERLGMIGEDAEYRTSLQMTLWRKSTLLSLLIPNETPWQFEVRGSLRSQVFKERFLCVQKKAFGIGYVFTAIVNGEWSPLAYDYARREGISVRFDALPQKSLTRRIKDKVYGRLYRYSRQIRQTLAH